MLKFCFNVTIILFSFLLLSVQCKNETYEDGANRVNVLQRLKRNLKLQKEENVFSNKDVLMTETENMLQQGLQNLIKILKLEIESDFKKRDIIIDNRINLLENNLLSKKETLEESLAFSKKSHNPISNETKSFNETNAISKTDNQPPEMEENLNGIQPDYASIIDNDWSEKMRFNWELNSTNEGFNLDDYEEESPEFELAAYSCSATFKLRVSGEYIRFFLSPTKNGKPYYFSNPPIITFILKDQMNVDENPKNVLRSAFMLPRQKQLLNANQKEPLYQIFHVNEFKKPEINFNGAVALEIQVEPPSKTVSTNGQLLWSLTNLEEKREKSGVSYEVSPSFYTTPRGFKVQAVVELDNEKKKLAVWVNVLRETVVSDYPVTPFDCKIRITIFNQEDSSKNRVVTTDEHKISDFRFFYVDVASYHEIEDTMDEDTVFFKVEIMATKTD